MNVRLSVNSGHRLGRSQRVSNSHWYLGREGHRLAGAGGGLLAGRRWLLSSGLCSVWRFIWLVIDAFLVVQDFSGDMRIQGMVRMLWIKIRTGVVALSDGIWQLYQYVVD